MLPLAAAAIESTTLVPLISFIPQRARRLVPAMSWLFFVDWISASVRAPSQTRVSSSTPWKRAVLAAVPGVDVSMTPRPACWVVSLLGVNAPTARVASRLPFR